MYTDRLVKEELERCVATACLVNKEDPKKYRVKYMGHKKMDKNNSLKYAYYVNVQNFDRLSDATKKHIR